MRSFDRGELGAMDRAGIGTAWHALDAAECVRVLEASPAGLSDAEAAARRARWGPNVFARAERVWWWSVLAGQFRGVLVALLAIAAAVSFVAGDRLDAAAILAVLALNVAIGFTTELRAHRAMEALLGLEVVKAVVVRDGVERACGAAELVPGDIVALESGSAVPADCRLLSGAEVAAIEAPLTGESVPVDKNAAAALDTATPLPGRVTMVYKGTMLIAGSARALVVATGMRTELGRIGELTAAVKPGRSLLERRLEVMGRRLAVVALGAAALTALVSVAQGESLRDVIGTALALAVAAVPEGLPVVATIAMAVGVRRMARRKALVRYLPAVEALGSTTLICSDKTGTLTAGEMTVTDLWLPPGRAVRVTGSGYAPDGGFEAGPGEGAVPDAELVALLTSGALANRAHLRQDKGSWVAEGDPTEAALLTAAMKAGLDPEALRRSAAAAGEVPFSSTRMLMAVFNRSEAGLMAHVKGAPHRVAGICTRMLTRTGEAPLDAVALAAIEAANQALASRGLRVLAVARGAVAGAEPEALRDLTFLGLAAMQDPPAAGVQLTLKRLAAAGLRTVMLTGDQRLTAEAVARDLGLLKSGAGTLDGAEVEQLGDQELASLLDRLGAVSRVSPEAKLRLVRAAQSRGEIVAMLGDGVNDAAALRQADIGVAMGKRGTDLAKEAAAVILQDDRFETIVAAVEEGRVIFDNIRKFVFYLFSCNLAEVLVVLAASLAGFPAPLLPLQILWLNLVTDTFPALALAMEPADPDLMRRPPRDPRAALIPAPLARLTVGYAVLIAAVSLAAFNYGLHGLDAGTAHAATLAFSTLALAQAFHLGNARSAGPVTAWGRAFANPWAVGAVVLVVALQFIAVTWQPLAGLLGLTPMGPGDWAVVSALGVLPGLVGQAVKTLRARLPAAR